MDDLSKLVETYAADIAERYTDAAARLGPCGAAWQYAVRPTVVRLHNRAIRETGVSDERGEASLREGVRAGRKEAIAEAAAFLRGLPPQTLSPALANAIATLIEANETIVSHREV